VQKARKGGYMSRIFDYAKSTGLEQRDCQMFNFEAYLAEGEDVKANASENYGYDCEKLEKCELTKISD